MKKSETMGIFALLLVTAAIAACIQAPGPAQGPAGDTVIKYKFYGGFIMPAYAIQELVVTKERTTFTISPADGNITERFDKALTKDQFNAIVKVFTDNNFDSYGDRYDEGQNHVTDVGFTDITFTANGKTKMVTTCNANQYLPAGLVRIREKLQETVEFTKMPGIEISLSYRPKMCEKTAWQSWEENSGRVYIRMPTDEEIIKHYYASVYNIEVSDVKKIQLDQVTCEACNVCLETYRFGFTVNASEIQPLLDEGWTRTD
jgi:hypothetical protein